MATLYTVSFDKMFGKTDAGGKWVIRGEGFAPLSKHSKKSAAVKAARRTASSGDKVEVRNKDGSLSKSFEVS